MAGYSTAHQRPTISRLFTRTESGCSKHSYRTPGHTRPSNRRSAGKPLAFVFFFLWLFIFFHFLNEICPVSVSDYGMSLFPAIPSCCDCARCPRWRYPPASRIGAAAVALAAALRMERPLAEPLTSAHGSRRHCQAPPLPFPLSFSCSPSVSSSSSSSGLVNNHWQMKRGNTSVACFPFILHNSIKRIDAGSLLCWLFICWPADGY